MDNYVIRAVASASGQNNRVKISVFEEFIPALIHLDKFSHIIIFVSGDTSSNLSETLPYAEIEEKVLKIKSINEKNGKIEAEGKLSGKASIYDIKPYFPIEDRVRKCISSGKTNSKDCLSFEKMDSYPKKKSNSILL